MTFSEIMDQTILAMEKNAAQFEDDKKEFSPIEFIRELRTIHLGYGRRTGKTQYINKKLTDEDFILFPDLRFSRFYVNGNVGSTEILNKEEIPRYKIIYVDEPALHNKLDECLNKLIKDHDQTVIMVGR